MRFLTALKATQHQLADEMETKGASEGSTIPSKAMRSVCFMATSPEELALDLSRASLQSQEQSENQLREKATAVLAAASIVVPVARLFSV